MVLLPFLVVCFWQLLAVDSFSAEPIWLTDMRYCDLVVRGTIETSSVELKKRNEVMPMLPPTESDVFVDVALVRMKVDEVMRGDFDAEHVAFVSFLSSSAFGDENYEPGRELVVGLIWGQNVLGGSYFLFSETTRFVRLGDAWEEQRGDTVLTDLSALRSALVKTTPRQILTQADAVVTGVVRDVRLDTVSDEGDRHAVQMTIALDNVRWLAGDGAATQLSVRQLMSGNYWPSWRDAAPWREMPIAGKEYCLFLKEIEEGYAVFGGVNGTFEVRDDHLYFAGRTPVNLTVPEIRRALEEK
ncbi:MAG TPA: hypothetical protein VEC56_00850 [Candidatus Krumholzibacteria bacterium]|nr:hypothetical protein [Candidatus Krumholzibacteria bacterium]